MESDLGQGSVFWVRLPFDDAGPSTADTAASPGMSDDVAVMGRTVLVIEDNAINRFVLRTLLEDMGYVVSEVADGIEGVAAASADQFDLILMDISMPRLDGIEAAKRIGGGNGASAAARIIAVTAHALPGELDRFRAAGMDDCLVKPVTRNALTRVMVGTRTIMDLAANDGVFTPVLDRKQLNSLLSRLDTKVANELLRRFLAEGDVTIAKLCSCPSVPDADKLCHRLAGSAATFGAKRLRAALISMDWSNLENQASRERQMEFDALWAEVKDELLAIFPALAP